MWQIRWDGSTPSYEYEQSLELVESDIYKDPYELVRHGKYGRVEALRRNLTFVHLTGKLSNLVYSMGVTNTDFYPHQYRPLLTLLESPANGILIADEVGLGKTIEAGLIWTEYRARYDKRRLLVICPAMLREKWRDELQLRFGIAAQIVGAEELLDELLRTPGRSSESAWIVSYQSARPPREWTPGVQGDTSDRPAAWRLADFLHQHADGHELLDMVVFDEAHYMRNRETGAWRLGNLLRGVSEFQIMLSATPINLKSDDLFSLLTLLDPEHFASTDDLERLLQSNRPLVAARDIALNLAKSLTEFRQALALATQDPLLAQSMQLRRLMESESTDAEFRTQRYRAEIADALERINLLSHVLTRTRKRDMQTRRIERRVFREAVTMSTAEREFYDAVTSAIRRYAMEHNVSDGFLLATPQRQVSSSPAALLRLWREGAGALGAPDDEFPDEFGTRERNDNGFGPLRSYLQATIPRHVQLAELESADSKLIRLQSLLRELFAHNPVEKVILFTAFRATASYLAERLTAAGIPATIVWGRSDIPKHLVIEEFAKDPAQRVLISTEVAAEGVDLQFSRTIVNYDLPWNPTRIEQRIGRVDRLGQKSDQIFVWNLCFAGTIDDRVVSRLLERLRIFEEALGEAEAVVGETVAELEYNLLSRPRSPEEENALIDRAALVLETVMRQRRELEENAPHMMAHGQRVLERIAASQALSRHVTELDLFTFVRDCLERYWPGHEFVATDADPMHVQMRLPGTLLAQWGPYLRERGALAQTRLVTGARCQVLFRNNITQRINSEREVIHQFHPLVGFLAADLKQREDQFWPIVALRLSTAHAPPAITAGVYAFSVFQWSFAGVQSEEWLISAAAALDQAEVLEAETADLLVQAARVLGDDWLGAASDIDGDAASRALELADISIERRYADALARKRAENADRARFQLDSINRHEARRLRTLEAVEQHHRERASPLVKAIQGQRRLLLERMETRRASVRSQEEVVGTSKFVCGGLIRVGGPQ